MNVTFGLHLDGESGWRPANRLGMPVLGPLGFLNLLETRLGLLRKECTHVQRTTQYRDCLKRCDAPDRFYHASFLIDPMGVSASLLSWRDEWYLHGWNGKFQSGASLRTADMAAVEEVASKLLFPSLGERLIKVGEELSLRQSKIKTVDLVDPIEAFPKRWREVLEKLPVRSVRTYAPSANKQTILGQVQIALNSAREGKRPNGKIPWSDDGSLRVVTAETRLVASRWLAWHLASHQNSAAIIAEKHRSLVDATLDAVDVPRQGFQESSSLVPALQVLPLALTTVWEPLDVYALLQFLSHPIGPMPRYARWRLAKTIAECPGIGGPRWRKAIQDIEKAHPDEAAEIREAVTFWTEHERYNPEQGAPLAVILERTRKVLGYFSAGLSSQDPVGRAVNSTGYGQAIAVAAALEALIAQGESSITPVQLEALISHCTARGAPNIGMDAQAGCVPSVSDAGALIEAFDQVIWWQMGAPSLPSRYPWSRSEIEQLTGAGVELPPLDDVLKRRGQDWIRPVLNAQKQLLLVLTPAGEEMHPLWQEIQRLVEGIRVESLEELLVGRCSNDLPTVAYAPLPRRRRWWDLSTGPKLSARPQESYSSLSTFLDVPYEYILRYAARLNPSMLLAVTDGNRLYGNLAHRLTERFFQSGLAQELSGDALSEWFSREFNEMVAEEGAVLLMPGRRADYERLRSTLKRALEELQRQFRAANVDLVEPERKLNGTFAGGELTGQADLVVRKQTGVQAIVDMKWGNANAYRDRLAKNRHLQLAVYAEMFRQETKTWPQVSYFIFDRSQLLASDKEFFPQALPIPSVVPRGTAALWEEFIVAWKWRRSQLDAGQIEVPIEGITPTVESEPPPGALQPEIVTETYQAYRWLAGWED